MLARVNVLNASLSSLNKILDRVNVDALCQGNGNGLVLAHEGGCRHAGDGGSQEERGESNHIFGFSDTNASERDEECLYWGIDGEG